MHDLADFLLIHFDIVHDGFSNINSYLSDHQVVSCSGDGLIYYTVLDREEDSAENGFDCHRGTAYEVSIYFATFKSHLS